MATQSNVSTHRAELYAAWARLIDSILPPPDENRLIEVAEVSQDALPFVQRSLADVGLAPIVTPNRSMYGETRYRVLVPARDAEVANLAVAGI